MGLEPRLETRVYLRPGFAISIWTYYEPAAPEIARADYAAGTLVAACARAEDVETRLLMKRDARDGVRPVTVARQIRLVVPS